MRVKQFPPLGTRTVASEVVTGGGCAANAPLAVARFDGRAAYARLLGGVVDAVSRRILQDLVAEGIVCPGAERMAGATALESLILIDPAGENSIATRRSHGLAHIFPADADAPVADAVPVDNRFPDLVSAVRQRHAGASVW